MKKSFLIVFLLASFFVFSAVDASAVFEPGTDQDPLVTMGYVEQRIEQLQYYVDKNFAKSGEAKSTVSNTESPVFEVVKLEAGQKVLFGASTEFILRSGEASIISGENGIADLTDGIDLTNTQAVPKNHHLLVPKADGRGFKCNTLVYVMIKGAYNVQ
jgi:hypothetical protein